MDELELDDRQIEQSTPTRKLTRPTHPVRANPRGHITLAHNGESRPFARYASIDCEALDDPTMTLFAKGLHAFLLTRPDRWTFNQRDLAGPTREGAEALSQAKDELERRGYLRATWVRAPDGTFWYSWQVARHPNDTWIDRYRRDRDKTSRGDR